MAQSQLDDNDQVNIDIYKRPLLRVANNIINLHAKPDSASEIVTQALFNALFLIETEENGYVYGVGSDQYKGWADLRYLTASNQDSSNDTALFPIARVTALIANVYTDATEQSELITKLVLSTCVELQKTESRGDFVAINSPAAEAGWVKICDLSPVETDRFESWKSADLNSRINIIRDLGKKALANAERFIGVPYLWGGCSPFGIDCSALVQVAFLMEGLSLLRDADLQFDDKRFCKIEEGKSLSDGKFEAGDLLVFGKNRVIIHIGLASDDGRFLHASGRQCKFGTYYDPCSSSTWGEIYMGAVRLAPVDDLSIESA